LGGQGPTGGGVETIDFPASAGFHASVQNLANPMPLAAITFEGAGYNVTGLPIELYGASITQSAAGSDAISTNLVLGHQLIVGGSGNLSLSGQITSDSGVPSGGINYNGSGALTLAGTGSQFDNLQVSSGNVTLNGGSARITGLELPALSVGPATLLIEGAAVFNGPTITYVGGTNATHGNLTVTGVGSKWTFGSTDGGFNGPGDFVIDAGSSATGGSMILGITSSSSLLVQAGSTLNVSGVSQFGLGGSTTATITGAGSTWTNSGPLQLGVDAAGGLNVTNGGSVTLGSTFTLGFNATGTVSIATGGSLSVADTTIFTNASVTVNGGTFSTALLQGSGGSIGLTNPALGTALTINGASGSDTFGGAITGTGSLLKSGGSTQTLTGSSSYGGGTTVSGGTLVIGAAGALPASGAVTNNANFVVFADTAAGNVTGSGTTIVGRDVTLSANNFIQNALSIDLGSSSAAAHSKLITTGNLSLGQLTITLAKGFAPSPGSYDILDWGVLASPIPSVNLPPLPMFLSWNTSQLQTAGTLVVLSTLPGDYNGNGVVDAGDYTIWRDTLGSMTDLRANGNDTGASVGKIDQADYVFWQSHYGNHFGSGSGASATVPEPATLLMLVVGIVTIWARRRQSCRKLMQP
jgi:T5SS/PEP-CTERM-associated repeat protein/autotransporter-associated beta strand protein